MKHEAEQQLLKTLNGQLSELPSVAKTMVQQYQMSAIVLSVLCGILFITCLVATIWLSIHFFKKSEKQTFSDRMHEPDYSIACMSTSMIGGALSLIMLGCLVVNVIHACAPIASLISNLFS